MNRKMVNTSLFGFRSVSSHCPSLQIVRGQQIRACKKVFPPLKGGSSPRVQQRPHTFDHLAKMGLLGVWDIGAEL